MSDVQTLVNAFFDALERSKRADAPPPQNPAPTEFQVRNHCGHLVVYHGGESVAKLKPEHAKQLQAELELAISQRDEDD